MEEIVAALQAQQQQVPIPLVEPTLEDIVEVQESLQITFPAVLREWLLSTGTFIVGYIEPVTVADAGSHTYLPEVAANAWSLGLPRDHLPICVDGDTYYCMDLEEQVVTWQDGQLGDDYWESIWHWTRDVWLQGDV